MPSSEDVVIGVKADADMSALENASASVQALMSTFMDLSNELDQVQENINGLETAQADIELRLQDEELTDVERRVLELAGQSIEEELEIEQSALDEVEARIQELDGGTISLSTETSGDETSVNEPSGQMSEPTIRGTSAGLVGVQMLASGVEDAITLTDNYNTSWKAIDSTFSKLGASHDEVAASIDRVTNSTAVSGAEARSFFQLMGNVGVSDTDALSKALENCYGQAALSGKSFEQVQSGMQRMIMSGNLSTRMLANMGLNLDKLAENLGMSSEEFSNAFKDATPEERLRMLNEAMGDTSEGISIANDSIKGQLKEMKQAFDTLLISAGTGALPTIKAVFSALIPVIQGVASALSNPVIGGIATVFFGAMAGAVGLSYAIRGINSVIGTMASSLELVNGLLGFSKSVESVSNLTKLGEAFKVLKAGIVTTIPELYAQAAAWWATATAEYAALLPIIAIIAAIVLIVVAIEKLGEYMGWWDSWSGMITVFKDKILELWDSFTNSTFVKTAIAVVQSFVNGLTSMMTFITTIPARIQSLFTSIPNYIRTSLLQARNHAITGAKNIFNGIVENIRKLPSMITTFIGSIPGIILGFMGSAVANALSFGAGVLNAVVSYVSRIPESVYNEFANVGQAIQRAVSSAVQAAADFGSQLWNAILDALGIASPGIIQRKIRTEFEDTSKIPEEYTGTAMFNARMFGQRLIDGYSQGQDTSRYRNLARSVDNTKHTTGNHTYNITAKIDCSGMTIDEAKQTVTGALENIRKPRPTGA